MGIPTISSTNDSVITPAGFYVIGFTNLEFASLFLIFIGFVYIVTVLFNFLIISVIWIEHRLHTPKYIAVANLAVVDLISVSSFIPSSINTVVTEDTFMTYNACLAQNFFYYLAVMLESYSLSVLAYDRLIAICFPLRHTSINTSMRMICILAAGWVFWGCIMAFLVIILNRLSFCDSLTVNNFVCEYGAVYSLSCNDSTLQWIASSTVSILFLFGPLGLIIMSYCCILTAVFRMKNVESRYKALATCSEQFFLAAIFYGPTMAVYIIEFFLFLTDPNIKMVNLALASSIPSCLNPIVYSLGTKEIRMRIFSVLRKVKISVCSVQA